jgi:hypothetical protein
MNLLERFFALILIIVVTACGTAKFQGKGASKNNNVDDRSSNPIVCSEENPCPNPCETTIPANNETSPSQSPSVSPSSGTVTCPVTNNDDDASQNSDHQSHF